MRVALLVLLTLVPFALGPAAEAASLCNPSCQVAANLAAFAPQVLAVGSGESVSFVTADVRHSVDAPGCMAFVLGSGRATFSLAGGSVFADSGAGPARCTTARAAGDSLVVEYRCRFHLWMVGEIAVS